MLLSYFSFVFILALIVRNDNVKIEEETNCFTLRSLTQAAASTFFVSFNPRSNELTPYASETEHF